MCLAIPGKLIERFEVNGLKMGRIDYSGTISQACLEYVPEIRIGEYAVVHAGFAISVLDEEEAEKTLALWGEMAEAAAEEGTDLFGKPLPDAGDDTGEGGSS